MSVETGRLGPDAVRTMFDRIAPVYDAMNRVMTAGLDQRWRRATVKAVVEEGDRVLDAACGTGDLGIIAAKAGGSVTGLDFSEPAYTLIDSSVRVDERSSRAKKERQISVSSAELHRRRMPRRAI